MTDWNEITIPIKVQIADSGRYLFWDADECIPRDDEGVTQVEIYLALDGWQEMSFNTGFGKSYDSGREGCWLKQKTAKNFKHKAGSFKMRVRYR